MGSPVGVFSNEEVKELSKSDIALLKAHVLNHIQTSTEIRRILSRDRTLLRKLTRDPRINKVLRREAAALKRVRRRGRLGHIWHAAASYGPAGHTFEPREVCPRPLSESCPDTERPP